MARTQYPLEYVALGLILFRPGHGYNLYQQFETHFASIWHAGRSKFYAKLTELHTTGWVTVEEEAQANRPTRKVYTATAQGEETFQQWLRSPVTPLRNVRIELLAKLQFFQLLHISGADQLLDAQIAKCEQHLLEHKQPLGEYAPPGDLSDLVHQFRAGQIQAMLDWLHLCQAHTIGAASR